MIDQQIKLFIETVTPLSTYPGRKGASGALQKILSEIPRCSLFIDAMCGSGFIGSSVEGCNVILNDIDQLIIQKIKVPSDRVEFTNQDYQQLIKRLDNGNPQRVFYFDPPYLMSTRSHKSKIYRYQWSTLDHKAFLKLMLKMKCPSMISHYPCELYDTTLKNWRKITYKSMSHGGVRDESLYMNYPQPVLLQCPNVAGENFTDRQRIKRKVIRLTNKLKNEDPKERAVILSSIIDNFSYVISK